MASTSRMSRMLAALGLCAAACFAAQSQAQCVGYSINATGPGTFVPGTTDIGLHADDGTQAIALPFNVDFYGTSYNSVTASTNGNLQFVTASNAYTNNCLPTATFGGPSILAFWDDQYTSTTAVGQGIFTATTGTAPNRVFVIEWRTQFCCATTAPINDYEVKFYEGQSFFDIVYSTPMSDRSSATIGAQAGGNPTDAFVQYVCNTAGPAANTSLRFNCITAATSGACCNTIAGTCAISTTAACTGAGFQFRGLGTSCPSTCPGQGACCGATGGCTISGLAGCASGSTYQGDGTVCTPYPCPPPPNDECGATNPVLVLGTPSNGSNIGATQSTTLTTITGDPFCGQASFATGTQNDVFWKFTPTVTATYDINTCGSSFDTTLAIHSACPADDTNKIACNDDSTFNTGFPACGTGTNSRVPSVLLNAGTTYTIRVAGYNGATGQIVLNAAIVNSGACCSSATGACTPTLTGAAGCAAGTVFQGNNSTCSPSPCTTQACCNPTTGVCTVVGTVACASGTTGQGPNTTCTPNPCPQPPPPANDDCAGAFPIVPNAAPIAGTNINSTDSLVTHSCTGSTLDVWYRFTTTGAASFTATADSDTADLISIVAYDGCGGSELACQAAVIDPATLTFTVPGAGTYFLRVATFTPATTYQLSLVSTVVGACCSNATGACTTSNSGAGGCAAGTTYQGDNTACGTVTCPTQACCNAATGACTLSGSDPCPSGSTGQGAGSTCATVTCPAEACCNAASGACTLAGPGQCASGTTGQGVGSSCTVNPCPQPPPPANDDCASAQALTLNVAFAGNNAQATGDGTEGPGGACYTTSPTTFSKAVWFSFTAPASDVFGVTACGSSFDTVLSVFDGTCAAFGAELGCDDDTCDGVTPPGSGLASIIAPVAMTAGQTYLIRLSSWGTNAGGAYTITVTGTAPAGGTCCRGSTCNASVADAAACSSSLIAGQTAGAAFVSTSTTCNATGNTTSPCCYANYNKTGGITVQDIFDFLNDWFAGSRYANTGGNGTPGALSVQNIFDFLNAWFAGGCS